ncbi:MAG: Rrf2 family transcriptional regulator [Bacteroidales bacterium]
MVSRTLVDGYLENRRIAANELAEYHKVKLRTLQPTLGQLVQANILNSKVGGRNRGYIFSRHPSTITVYDITSVLQGDMKMHCSKEVIEGIRCEIEDCCDCLMFSKFSEIMQEANNTAKSLTLMELYNDYTTKKGICTSDEVG